MSDRRPRHRDEAAAGDQPAGAGLPKPQNREQEGGADDAIRALRPQSSARCITSRASRKIRRAQQGDGVPAMLRLFGLTKPPRRGGTSTTRRFEQEGNTWTAARTRRSRQALPLPRNQKDDVPPQKTPATRDTSPAT